MTQKEISPFFPPVLGFSCVPYRHGWPQTGQPKVGESSPSHLYRDVDCSASDQRIVRSETKQMENARGKEGELTREQKLREKTVKEPLTEN